MESADTMTPLAITLTCGEAEVKISPTYNDEYYLIMK